MQKLRTYTEMLEAILKKYVENDDFTSEMAITALQALLANVEDLINSAKLVWIIHLSKLLETEIKTCCERIAEEDAAKKQKSESRTGDVVIYTDGACSGNPGRGGWCAILRCGDKERVISGGEERTTNNRMELMAVIAALQRLRFGCNVKVVTDSKYVSDAFNKGWLEQWKECNFLGRPNDDLWRELDALVSMHTVTFEWVKGHNGDPYNERCDNIASSIAQGISDY